MSQLFSSEVADVTFILRVHGFELSLRAQDGHNSQPPRRINPLKFLSNRKFQIPKKTNTLMESEMLMCSGAFQNIVEQKIVA